MTMRMIMTVMTIGTTRTTTDDDNGGNDATIKNDNYDDATWIIINNYKSNRLVINNYCLTNLRDCIRSTYRLVTFSVHVYFS